MTTPPIPFTLDCCDDEFARRMPAQNWMTALELRNHPDFLQGLKRYAELIPDHFADNIILNKVVTEAWRFEMIVYILYLYDRRDPANPRSGLTMTNLQNLCTQQKCASRGRVLAILGMMTIAGYLKRVKSGRDSRVVQLEPSEHFLEIVEGWNRRILLIIDAIMPEGGLAQSHSTHRRFGWMMRGRGAEQLQEGWKLLDPFPEVNHFVSSDGGWMLLLTCAAEALRLGNGVNIAPVSLDLKIFGARFGASRSHLRRLLESAYAGNLLLEPPKNGTNIVLAPRLLASFLACMAAELGEYRKWALEAQLTLEGR